MTMDEELIESLRRSKERFGALYPVLQDPEGNVIDGVHRIMADPEWPKVTIDWLKSSTESKILRLASNWLRRTVPDEEKAESLAAIAKETGWSPKELAENLGVSYRTVMRYLPDELKRAGGYERPPEKRIAKLAIQEEKKPKVSFMGRPVEEAAELLRTKKGREQLREEWEKERGMEEGEGETAGEAEEAREEAVTPRPVTPEMTKCPLCGTRVASSILQLKVEELYSYRDLTVPDWLNTVLGRR